MSQHTLTPRRLEAFRQYLLTEERSAATVEKYLRDIGAFARWLRGAPADKRAVLAYKAELSARYAPASVNSMLAALNAFFAFAGWAECHVKALKIQRQSFSAAERELTRAEYLRLCRAAEARRGQRLSLVMQTLCATGMRVSELRFVTAEAVRAGRSEVTGKGKRRTVFLPKALCRRLHGYLSRQGITSGPVFLTRNGRPLGRSQIWADMKALCTAADVPPQKVFPHNLRHLFARTFYTLEKDLGRLADILGHASVNTTRIYTMESGAEHRRLIERLHLVS